LTTGLLKNRLSAHCSPKEDPLPGFCEFDDSCLRLVDIGFCRAIERKAVIRLLFSVNNSFAWGSVPNEEGPPIGAARMKYRLSAGTPVFNDVEMLKFTPSGTEYYSKMHLLERDILSEIALDHLANGNTQHFLRSAKRTF
jgi:hypothetical protein